MDVGGIPCITPEGCDKKKTDLIKHLFPDKVWIPAEELPFYEEYKRKKHQVAFLGDSEIHKMD